MADFEYDLFVIGAGSGGVRAARIAANRELITGLRGQLAALAGGGQPIVTTTAAPAAPSAIPCSRRRGA